MKLSHWQKYWIFVLLILVIGAVLQFSIYAKDRENVQSYLDSINRNKLLSIDPLPPLRAKFGNKLQYVRDPFSSKNTEK